MRNLLRWWLTFFFPVTLRIGGDDGGGGSAGDNYEAEEARKAELRKRVDRLYGIDAPSGKPAPTREQFTKKGRTVDLTSGELIYDEVGNLVRESTPDTFDQAGYDAALAEHQAEDSEAAAARVGMEGQNTRLADATRGYYTDQLGRKYQKAERETRFKLARQGLLGGSEDIYQQDEVKSDRDLGATRVDEAVRRAVADLNTRREQERLNAVQLVNAGAGDSAVSAAQAGLKNTFEAAESAQRAELFGDLFSGAADAATADTLAQQQAALLGRYRDKLGAFFPTRSTSSGRITASA